MFGKVKAASRELSLLNEENINAILLDVADEIGKNVDFLLAANAKDLDRMDKSSYKYDRLKLTAERLEGIASDIRHVSELPSPLGKVLKHTVLPNGLDLKRISVPFGVIGVIYEARPNVSFDVFSLCLKSGNACVLKGGSDADCSNRAIVELIHRVLGKHGVNKDVLCLLPAGRESTTALLNARGFVDLIIPRGSSSLINYVRDNATIPVIETGAGVCHAYFDEEGDLQKGQRIVYNAKTRRVSVCNALDCTLVHVARMGEIAELCAPLADSNVEIYADEMGYSALEGTYPLELLHHSNEEHYGMEWQSYTMSLKVVESVQEAIEHISRFGSGHSECIITENEQTAELFGRIVDAACVYTNAPTSFTDGAQFGLGAEIGISTQKLHARGPMALEEITTYKWIIKGEGQVRS